MMLKKWTLVLLSALMLIVIAAGCTPVTPKQVLQEAFVKSQDIKKVAFEAGLSIVLEPKDPVEDPQMGMALAFLKDAQVTVTGKYDETAKRLEMNVKVASNGGDMKLEVNVPIIMDGDKLYVKVPQVPFYPVPKELVGKYILVDLKDKLPDASVKAEEEAKMEVLKAYMKEVIGIFVDGFGGTEFVTELKKDEIPTDVKDAKHAIQFKVTDANLEKAVNLLVKTTLPKAVDLMNKEQYMSAFNMTPEDVKRAHEDLNTLNLGPEKFAELRKSLQLNEASFILGINKDNYIVNEQFNIDADVKDPMQAHVKAKLSVSMSDIGKEQQFSPVPQGNEVIDSKSINGF